MPCFRSGSTTSSAAEFLHHRRRRLFAQTQQQDRRLFRSCCSYLLSIRSWLVIHCLRTSATRSVSLMASFAGTRVLLSVPELREAGVPPPGSDGRSIFARSSSGMAIHGSLTASGFWCDNRCTYRRQPFHYRAHHEEQQQQRQQDRSQSGAPKASTLSSFHSGIIGSTGTACEQS